MEEMENRSRRRTRDLVTRVANQGLSENENGRARISMMAKSVNALFTGRIQKRKTNPRHRSHPTCNTRPVHTNGSRPDATRPNHEVRDYPESGNVCMLMGDPPGQRIPSSRSIAAKLLKPGMACRLWIRARASRPALCPEARCRPTVMPALGETVIRTPKSSPPP